MALFKYGFKRMRDEAVLPDPREEEANNKVKDVLRTCFHRRYQVRASTPAFLH